MTTLLKQSSSAPKEPSLTAGFARWLEDSLSANGLSIHLGHDDVELGIKKYLKYISTGNGKDAAYGRKQVKKKRIILPYSSAEESAQQVRCDCEQMKHELDSGLEKCSNSGTRSRKKVDNMESKEKVRGQRFYMVSERPYRELLLSVE